MADQQFTAPEVQLAEGCTIRIVQADFNALRRGDPQRGCSRRLTLAQLSILVTLLDQVPSDDRPGRSRTGANSTTVAIRRLEGGLVKRSRDRPTCGRC